MNFFRSSFFFLPFSFLVVSCSGNEPVINQTPDTLNVQKQKEIPKDTFAFDWPQLRIDTLSGDSSLIIISGYVGDIGTYVEQKFDHLTFPVFSRRNQRAGFHLNVKAPVGTAPNQVHELPAQFVPEDFKIVSTDGILLTQGAYVQIAAIRRKKGTSGNIIACDLVSIRELEKGTLDTLGALPLTHDVMNDSTVQERYVYLEGIIELPEYILPYTTEIKLALKNSSVENMETIDIRLGEGPGTMNDLPDDYTESDLIIRDFKGEEIPYGSRVRIYGIWERNTYASSVSGRFYAEEIVVIR